MTMTLCHEIILMLLYKCLLGRRGNNGRLKILDGCICSSSSSSNGVPES